MGNSQEQAAGTMKSCTKNGYLAGSEVGLSRSGRLKRFKWLKKSRMLAGSVAVVCGISPLI
jgi:hypothetical protein